MIRAGKHQELKALICAVGQAAQDKLPNTCITEFIGHGAENVVFGVRHVDKPHVKEVLRVPFSGAPCPKATPNIVTVQDWLRQSPCAHVQTMTQCPVGWTSCRGTSFLQWVHDNRHKEHYPTTSFKYLMQAMKGVAHLHRNRIVHGDLKLENATIVPTERGFPILQLIDFDTSGREDTEERLPRGTIENVCPEVLVTLKKEHGSTVRLNTTFDAWSMACMVVRAASGLQIQLGGDDLTVNGVLKHNIYLFGDWLVPIIRARFAPPGDLVDFMDGWMKLHSNNPPNNTEVLRQNLNRYLPENATRLTLNLIRECQRAMTVDDRANIEIVRLAAEASEEQRERDLEARVQCELECEIAMRDRGMQ
jgi:serine/threonine protein kinase